MASSTWHLVLGVVCFCLLLLVQGGGSVLATNEVNVLPSYVKTSTGSSFTLDCAQPENTSVVWYQPLCILLDVFTIPKMFITVATFLHFFTVSSSVNVLPSYVKTSTGSSFTLDCAQPENTSVVWYQGDKRLETTTSQLTIPDVTAAHAGTYKCCLKECTTGNFASAVVDIGEGPRQPTDLYCVCHNLIDINCTWSMSDDGDINSNITLQILDYDKNIWEDLTICKFSNSSPHDKDQYCYFNLLENNFGQVQYKYVVHSANEYGELYSNSMSLHKTGEALPHPPDKVTMGALTSSTLNLTWCKPPEWPESQARVLLFKVEYKVEGAELWLDGGVKQFQFGQITCTSMKINSLEPYTSYCAQVKAQKKNSFHRNRWSKPSTMVCATTMESAPGPPFDVKYKILPSANEEKETRTAVISWQHTPKEERNGIIIGYRIVLQGFHGNDHTNRTILEYNVTGDATNLTVAGLDNYRQYTITVQAFNSAGISMEKASPDGNIPVAEGSSAPPVPKFLIYLLIPISLICMLFFAYCIWHRGKKILKPTYDIQIPERARNDNLYVTTVNFRMQESECFDELKAPPSSDLQVDLPPNGTCTYGNGTCPTSDYSEDPCTPGLASSENFPLLSGHRLEANGNSAGTQENKMLTVDCGEGKALLDGHPYSDVGYNHTGSPLSVASGGSYWTTGDPENESVSYHRMSPKGLALYEADADEQGAASGEPTTPDSPSRHMDYSMMGRGDGPLADHARATKAPSTEKDNLVSSPTSPTSPVALYSMQASALDPVGDEDSVVSDDDGNDISCYVRQTTANSLGLLVPVPQVPVSDGKKKTDSEKERKETNRNNEPSNLPAVKVDSADKKEDDAHSLSSEEGVDDALDPYVQTGATNAPQRNQETPGSTAVDNYVRAGRDRDTDFDRRRDMPRIRSQSGGALDAMRRTHSSAPDFLEDSDSAISMEDADLHYVQAGCLEEVPNLAVPPSPVLPGVAIDFPSDGSEDIPTGSTLAPGDENRSRSHSGDRHDLSDNDLSDMEYERYNKDDAIDGYVTQGVGVDGQESHPMLPYIAIDLAQAPQKRITHNPPVAQQGPGLPQPVSLDSGYVPQNQAHMMGVTKDETPQQQAEKSKSAYDNPEYGVLAQCLSELERKKVDDSGAKTEDAEGSKPNDAGSRTASNESLTGSPTNNNSPYVPHGKAPLGQSISKCPSSIDSGYLPHGKIPGQAISSQNPDVVEINGMHSAEEPQPKSPTDRGYIPINNIPAV